MIRLYSRLNLLAVFPYRTGYPGGREPGWVSRAYEEDKQSPGSWRQEVYKDTLEDRESPGSWRQGVYENTFCIKTIQCSENHNWRVTLRNKEEKRSECNWRAVLCTWDLTWKNKEKFFLWEGKGSRKYWPRWIHLKWISSSYNVALTFSEIKKWYCSWGW